MQYVVIKQSHISIPYGGYCLIVGGSEVAMRKTARNPHSSPFPQGEGGERLPRIRRTDFFSCKDSGVGVHLV